MDGANDDAAHQQSQCEREPDLVAHRRTRVGQHAPNVVERQREHCDAECALGPLDPSPRLWKRDREGPNEPEQHTDTDCVDEQRDRTERDVPGRGHPGQQNREDRPGARSGDEPVDEPEHERASHAEPARLCEPIL